MATPATPRFSRHRVTRYSALARPASARLSDTLRASACERP